LEGEGCEGEGAKGSFCDVIVVREEVVMESEEGEGVFPIFGYVEGETVEVCDGILFFQPDARRAREDAFL
jgi:hypothetical protein